jgi:Cu(I)/Ag(I) efflux system membrane fusion protein
MKTFLLILISVAVAGTGGWWLGSHREGSASSAAAEKRVLYYQSPMHPWVKADKPGNCTVCGMAMVPIYEGGETQAAAGMDVVLLPEGSPTVSNVRTVEVKRQPLGRTLRVAGVIDDDESKFRILSAYTPGRIEKLAVNFEGAEVEKGQPLATYYSKELLTAANEYRLVAKQGVPAVRAAAESRLRQLGMTAEQIAKIPERNENALFFDIVAPATGTVVRRFVYEGQYVQEGEKLFEIADFSTMWFQFIAYEQDLPFLQEGQKVTITAPSLPGRTIQAAITFINPNLDEATRSARVRVQFDNPMREGGLHRGHEVLHKSYAEATVSLAAPEVVTVPRNAVLWTSNYPRVYVEQAPGAY